MFSTWRPTLRYWMQTEVHVYSFSIAANVLLSFFPFLIVITSLCRHVLGWQGAVDAIYAALRETFPGQWSEWLIRNLRFIVDKRGPVQFVPILVLFFTANGVFEPLEVALNRTWNVQVNRSFLRNQLVSLGLVFACGSLMLLSLSLSAANAALLARLLPDWKITNILASMFFHSISLSMTILVIFLIYWLVPNRDIAWRSVVPVAILAGLAIEALKWLTIAFWPHIDEKFYLEYGPFEYSAIMIFWSFLASMIVLAGGEWAARRRSGGDGCVVRGIGNDIE
ncbi:MAG: YihY/virulence factor BrkB family protein [Candidatus Solibacter usitatus]|nr:YihY/virulence factor BrkB family protein [Candidatus Solibacter usitatus]